MTTTPQTYKIRNVEGVADLTVDLHPGVNVLTGENEAGKTSAIRAITRASGATDQPLALRDGAANGSVRGPGVMLNVGKKVRTTGQPTVTLADYGSLAALVDPPIKGRAARDKARLRALLDLLPQALTERDLLELASGEEEVVAGVQGVDLSKVDLLEGAAKVGEMAHALARDYEGRRDEARGAARNASENLATLDLEGLERPPLGVEELEMTLEASVGRLTRARDGAEQRKLFESKQAEIRATIGERPDVEAAEAAVDAASTKVDQARAELARLEAELSTARSRRAEAQEAADRWRGQNDLLSAPVSGPTAEDVAAAEAEVESARVALDAGRAFAQHDLLEASLSDSTQEADGHESKGRESAGRCASSPREARGDSRAPRPSEPLGRRGAALRGPRRRSTRGLRPSQPGGSHPTRARGGNAGDRGPDAPARPDVLAGAPTERTARGCRSCGRGRRLHRDRSSERLAGDRGRAPGGGRRSCLSFRPLSSSPPRCCV